MLLNKILTIKECNLLRESILFISYICTLIKEQYGYFNKIKLNN